MKHVIQILLILASFTLTPALWADNVSYTFSIQNAPGGIGNFSWTVTTAALDESLNTKNWNAASNPSAGGGCQISGILLEAEGTPGDRGYGMTTFFTPLCDGLFDSETSGFAVSPAEFGTYTFSGANPDGTENSATFTIAASNLPVTTPEPATWLLLAAGLLFVRGRKAS